ncbi:hypothetical protein DEU56DRAFT_908937 [Suillus clintonianus]|uniref:uncharacterized protein n=1 Tax=Suillus clintonianus TaxID=1904413 RepID=UPI001B85FA2B|nr:uncharacterized protein DEU56DRAFT_908937 [Suillus clintonianus]KAG2149238.1 hypothetical protein DEU56DRAFT_908937 [Suillus clintonianus]
MAPAGAHSKTIDYGMKLSLLMSAPIVNDVPTLDRLTTVELNHLILHELAPQNDNTELSYMLSQIFGSFTFRLPDTSQQVHHHRQKRADADQHQWNWPLPNSHHNKVKRPGDGSLEDREEQSTMAGTESGSGDDDGPSLEEEPASGSQLADDDMPDTPPPPFEGVFVMFFNVICFAITQKVPKIVQATNVTPVSRMWSVGNATHPVKDEEVTRKPGLALLDDVEAQWDTIKVVCELTSQPYSATSTIGKTLDNKAYFLF